MPTRRKQTHYYDPIKQQLVELNGLIDKHEAESAEVANGGRTRPAGNSSAESRPDRETPQGNRRTTPRGERNAPAGNGYSPSTPGVDGRSLENSKSTLSRLNAIRGRTEGVSSRESQTGGQTPRKAPTVQDIEAFVLGKLKRALAYAGFDVKGDARSLTESEQKELEPDVARFIQRVGMALDYTITHTNAAHNESDIWTFEDEEAASLAKIYLKRARYVGWMATVARQAKHLEDLGEAQDVASIVGKRIGATMLFYHDSGGFKPWLR